MQFLFILFFIAYSVCTFVFFDFYVVTALLVLNLLLAMVFKVKFKKILSFTLKISIFCLTVFALNLLFASLKESLLITEKILTISFFAFVVSSVLSKTFIASGIAQLFYPLKIFKVNTDEIFLICIIGLNFIDIIKKSFTDIKIALKTRNVDLKWYQIKNYSLLFKLFFEMLFIRIDDMEISLKARGF